MTSEPASSLDEYCASLLAACDDALAAGEPTVILQSVEVAPDVRKRLERGISAMRLLRQIFPAKAQADGQASGATAELPWKKLGRFEMRRELGRGSYGLVYLAYDPQLCREVALKIPRPESILTPELRDRFMREARAAAGLEHPNLVPVYEVGEAGPICYIASAYCPGQTLAAWLKERGDLVPWRTAAGLIATLADALEHAHLRGVLHRDLKPANILLQSSEISGPTEDETGRQPDRQGEAGEEIRAAPSLLAFQPKVTDFGLAKSWREGKLDQTKSDAIIGTPNYMAPEQAAGRSRDVGPAADVYSLGGIFYELLTGRPPFQAESLLETLEQVRSQEPVPPARLRPRLPRDLETICLKCLEKEPRKRYASAQALRDDLRRFLEDCPILARRTSPVERAWRWSRRNPAIASLSLGLASMAVLVCIGSVLAAMRLGRSAEHARSAERDTQEQLFDSLLVQAGANRTSRRPGQRLDSLKALAHAAMLGRILERDPRDLRRLRNEAIACMALPDLQLTEWEGNLPGTNGIGFDATFERFAWSFQGEGIRVCRLRDHVEEFRLPTPPSDRISRWVLLGFSPDGRYLAAYYVQWAEKHPLEVWDLGEGAGRRVVSIPDVTALPAFGADGRSLVSPLPTGEAGIIELPSGAERRRLSSGGPVEAVAIHPGGNLLAVAGGRNDGVRVLDLERGAVAHRLPHPDTVQGVAWSADGKLLATACNDLLVRIWDTDTWQKGAELKGHRWEVGEVAFDATGKWLASFGWDMTLRIWDVGSQREVLNVEDIRVLGFRSRGELAAAGVTGQRVQIWSFRPSEVLQELHHHQSAHPTIQFSPDGCWLTTMGGPQADFRVWDISTGREVYHGQGQRGGWSRDGTHLLCLGASGLSKVPLLGRTSRSNEAPVLRFGEPQPLAGLQEDVRNHFIYRVGSRRLFLLDPPDARTLRSRVRLLERDGETIRVHWQDWKLNASSVAASCDGRLVSVGSYWGGSGVSVWEADTGRLVCELPIGDAHMAFAVDGSRMFTTTGRLSPRGAECRSWRVGSWELDRALPLKRASHSPATLSVAADGTVGVVFTMSDVRLLDPETLDEIMTLSTPQPELLQGVEFSPDGKTLATSSSGTVQVWNLPRLRQELAKLGLDWLSVQHPLH
jgi:serine/threonine protein kinase/WD40 repeat protein